jgi:glycosyltransferase involved in cell wall biosynthesis
MGKRTVRAAVPTVSLLTPTFNRRAFFAQCVRCVLQQDYPREKMEWIILDDGTDRVADMLPDPATHPWVRYVPLEERLPLGEKRNRLHALATGDVLLYVDDDDYYPPTRVSRSVDALLANPAAMAVGCSEIPVWFVNEDEVWFFGPYRPGHASCGTLAFRRAMVAGPAARACVPSAAYAEEQHLLNDWRVPLVQLDPRDIILCVAHGANTVDKRTVRDRMMQRADGAAYCRRSFVPGSRMVRDADSRAFYRALRERAGNAGLVVSASEPAEAAAAPSPSATASAALPTESAHDDPGAAPTPSCGPSGDCAGR